MPLFANLLPLLLGTFTIQLQHHKLPTKVGALGNILMQSGTCVSYYHLSLDHECSCYFVDALAFFFRPFRHSDIQFSSLVSNPPFSSPVTFFTFRPFFGLSCYTYSIRRTTSYITQPCCEKNLFCQSKASIANRFQQFQGFACAF